MSATPGEVPLRDRALRSGVQLAARSGVSLVLAVTGSLLLVALMGADDYGRYAGALIVSTLLAAVATCGVDVVLIRGPGGRAERSADLAFSLLLVTTATTTVLGLLATLPARSLGYGDYVPALQALLVLLPLNVLWVPAQAQLERAMRYGPLAVLEILGTLVYYVVAIGTASAGWGVWAGVAGYGCWQLVLLLGSCRLAGYRPRPAWDPRWVRQSLRWGAAYSGSQWLWRLRELLNPLVVGALLGPAAVGQVALAVRLVDNAAFVRRAAWRLSIVVFDRVARDREQLARALQAAARAQVLLVGAALAGAAAAVPTLLVPVLGEEWAGVQEVFPYIAVGVLVNATFAPHAAALYVLGHARDVAWFHAVHVMLAAAGMALMVPVVGLAGYGAGELCALLSYPLLTRALRRRAAVGTGAPLLLLLGGLLPSLCLGAVPLAATPLLLVPAVGALLLPEVHRPLLRDLRDVRRAMSRRAATATAAVTAGQEA